MTSANLQALPCVSPFRFERPAERSERLDRTVMYFYALFIRDRFNHSPQHSSGFVWQG